MNTRHIASSALVMLSLVIAATSAGIVGASPHPVLTQHDRAVSLRSSAASNQSSQIVHLEGVVTSVVSDSEFTMSGGFTILISPTTELLGFDSVLDLVVGDGVAVDGLLDGQVLLAHAVELGLPGGVPTWVAGRVDATPTPDLILLEDGTAIRVTGETALQGFAQVSDLRPGDLVEAQGWPEGGELLAELVVLIETAPEEIQVSGSVAFLDFPSAFVLDSGQRVVTGPLTQWLDIDDYHDLAVGDRVEVTGTIAEGALSASLVRLIAAAGPAYTTKEGWIFQRPSQLELVLHDDTILQLRPDVALDGIPSVADLQVGDRVRAGGYTTNGGHVIDVIELELLERPGEGITFESVVTAVTLATQRFRTANGYQVEVNAGTVFEDFDELADLAIGDGVAVNGVVGSNLELPELVIADRVTLTRDASNGSEAGGLQFDLVGVVGSILPTGGFVLDGFSLRTLPDTVWTGTLSAESDLDIGHGCAVRVSMVDVYRLEALSVRGLTAGPTQRVDFSGSVVEFEAGPSRARLDDGTWIALDEIVTVDGDVADPDAISIGMWLEGSGLVLVGGDVLALEVEVSIEPSTVEELGFDNGPVDEALVLLDQGAQPAAVAERHGAHVAGTLPGRLVYLFVWDVPPTLDALQSLLDDTDVVVVEPNRAFTDPESDPESIRRRAIAIDRSPVSTDFSNQYAVQAAKLGQAHETSVGAGTIVAVIDTGVDPFHPLLRHRLAPNGADLVDGDTLPWETADGIDQDGDGEVDEAVGHGTFVSGLVLLAAPGTTILPYRALNDDGRGTTFDICRAVILAMDAGVDVINMSFTYPERSRVLDRILKEASERGVVLVSGAGNTGSTVLPFPAMDSRVLAVAALDSSGVLADFSNHGVAVSLGAPGVDLYSSGPDGTFGTWSGTSMAAPLVSGTAALLRSVNPALTVAQITDALKQSSSEPVATLDIAAVLDAAAALELVPEAQ